jgi:5'-nucleotidase
MNKPRRIFLNQISLLAGSAALCKPMDSAAAITKHINTLHVQKNAITVYSTNDIRGNVDAVHKNTGGLSLIKTELQKQETSGLLLDAGNFINSTQSLYRQKQLIALMNSAGYHVAAVGSQELLLGQDHLATLAPFMKFALLNCNYEFKSSLKDVVKSYAIITTGRFRVGITAVGSQLNGVKYNDAINSANRVAGILKNDERCDLVICLSHLGYVQEGNTPDNQKLAAQSENIDIIIGGNSNKLLSNAVVLKNKLKHEVILAQTAWNGMMMGRTIVHFDDDKQKTGLSAKHIIPGVPAKSFAAEFSNMRLAKNLPV